MTTPAVLQLLGPHSRRHWLGKPRKKVVDRGRQTVLALLTVALLTASGCASGKKVSQSDTAACHAFGPWLQKLHANQTPPSTESEQVIGELEAASSKDLRSAGITIRFDIEDQNATALQGEISSVAQDCVNLGLIDDQGNPT